jgi:hypothetical protein
VGTTIHRDANLTSIDLVILGGEEQAKGITFSEIEVVVLGEDLENHHKYGL